MNSYCGDVSISAVGSGAGIGAVGIGCIGNVLW
jgi:hypothetical protein